MMNLAEDVMDQILADDNIISDSSWVPLWDVLFSHHHDIDLALKSPSIMKYDDWSGSKIFQSLEEVIKLIN